MSQGYYRQVDTIFHVRTITEDYAQSSDTSSPNTPTIMVKNKVDVIAYAENNQTEPSEVYYGIVWTDASLVLIVGKEK